MVRAGVVTLSCSLAVLGLGAVVSTPPAGAATIYGWTATSALPSWVGNQISLSCVATGTCAGLATVNTTVEGPNQDAGMLTTSNGGSSWSGAVSLDSENEQPGTIDCIVGTTDCVATAISDIAERESEIQGDPLASYAHTLILTSGNSGGSWESPTIMYDGYANDSANDGMDGYGLDCLSTTHCLMVAGMGTPGSSRAPGYAQEVLAGTPGNPIWSLGSPFTGPELSTSDSLSSVSCTSSSDCWVAGDDQTTGYPVMFSTTNGGGTWSGQDYAVSGYGYASNITCQDGTFAGAPSALPQYADCQMIVTDGGHGYGLNNQGQPPQILTSTNGGASWAQGSMPNLDGVLFKGITCPTASVCLAYGWVETNSGTLQGIIEVTTDGGVTWTTEEIANTKSITGLSCVSVAECYAVGATGPGSTSLQDPGTSSVIFSTTDLGLPQAEPAAPTNPVATAAIDSATVSWTASSPGYGNQPVQSYVVVAYDANTNAEWTSTTVSASQTTATFTYLSPGVPYYFEVYATDLGPPVNGLSTSYVGPNSAPSNTIVPTNAPESGVAASGTNPAPAGTLNDGSPLTATSVGSGTVTVGSYPYSPQAGLASGTTYFDVDASGSLSLVTISACDPNLTLPLQWWDPAIYAWEDVSPAATLSGGCLTWTATATSSPSVSELYGTAFAAFVDSAPDTPTDVTATSYANGQSVVSWTAPYSNGGETISEYTVQYSADGGQTWTSAGSTQSTTDTVSGLTNGTSYLFEVSATNAIGTSTFSAPSAPAIPATVPGAPTAVKATSGANGQSVVSWIAPSSNGGMSISFYRVQYSADGGQTWAPVGSSDDGIALLRGIADSVTGAIGGTTDTVTGLTNGTSYLFEVSAGNNVGTGAFSAPSAPAVPAVPATVPGAPTAVKATSFTNEKSKVSWTAPSSNGGAAISSYTVEYSADGGHTWTSGGTTGKTTYTVSGLTNGMSYLFEVSATNGAGTGANSAPSAPATPATVPTAPTAVTATSGANGQSVVSWTAPSSNGGATISAYAVRYSADGGHTWTSAGSTAETTDTVTGLTNGTSYLFEVSATNGAGTGANSAASSPAIPATVPGAPTITSTKPGNKVVAVFWSPPSSNGGSAITGYTVEHSADGGHTWTSAGSTAETTDTVTGLTNGTSYLFEVSATNGIGTSLDSTAVQAIPALVPGAPSHVTAAPGNDSATVTWQAATVTGGSPITGYVVHASPGGSSCTSTGTSCVLTGLTNGTTYQVIVAAENAVGTGAATAPVAVRPRSVPGAPTITGAVAGDKQVTVSWSDLVTNGEPITSYTVTSAPSSKTCVTATTSCTVKGLTNGTSYTFTVRATNLVGQGPSSPVSSAAVPGLHGVPTLKLSVSGTLKTGDQVTITATIEAGAAGTIGIADQYGQLCGAQTIVASSVTCQWTFESTGTYQVVATFDGSVLWASTTVTHPVVITHGTNGVGLRGARLSEQRLDPSR
jgi:hypothetical protein